MKDFTGRVAVVTGAGGGIGRAVCLELAKRGTHVALVDLDATALEESARLVAEYGVNTSTHIVDVASKAEMEALPAAVLAVHGKVNILVNNAGITYHKLFSTHTLEDWEKMVGVNWWGVLYGCHYFLEPLKAAGEGHIINISSMAAFVSFPYQSSYCATKAAVKAFSECLWWELSAHNIGVTSVHPGVVRTNILLAAKKMADDENTAQKTHELMQKIGVKPERAAKRIVNAIEHNRFRIRIGADSIMMDWAKRCFPHGIQLLLRKLLS